MTELTQQDKINEQQALIEELQAELKSKDELNAKLHPQWQPIDYSNTYSDSPCFSGDPVLIKKEDFITSVKWIDGRWVICGRHIVQGRDVATHWMPLPEFLKG